MSAQSSAESEASNLDSKEQEVSNPPGLSSATLMHKPCSESTGPTPRFMTTLRRSILAVFLLSACSPEDSHAKTSAMLEKELALRGVVLHSGVMASKQLGFCDPESRSLRTWQHSINGDSTVFSATLPRSGMMRNGIVYRLPPLVRLTVGTESQTFCNRTPWRSGSVFSCRSVLQGPTCQGRKLPD